MAPRSLEVVAPEGKLVVAAGWWLVLDLVLCVLVLDVQVLGGREGGRQAAAQTVVVFPSTFLSPATPGSHPVSVALLLPSPEEADLEALRAERVGIHQLFGLTTLVL